MLDEPGLLAEYNAALADAKAAHEVVVRLRPPVTPYVDGQAPMSAELGEAYVVHAEAHSRYLAASEAYIKSLTSETP